MYTLLWNNYKICGDDCEKIWSEEDLTDKARMIEYNTVCSTKSIARYRYLITQKVGKDLLGNSYQNF